MTHKNKPVTDFEASTILLQLFLWWKDIPITIKINVRKSLQWASFLAIFKRQSGLKQGAPTGFNSLLSLALALWGHHTDIFTKNCGKSAPPPVLARASR